VEGGAVSRKAGAGPRTVQSERRSDWVHTGSGSLDGVNPAEVHQRRTGDGVLAVIVGDEVGIGWHLSISHRSNHRPPRLVRYPTWDEVAEARERFLPADLTFAMVLPPLEEFVNVHHTTFHLHQVAG
jgi:hypothetical protein